jgi:hypothetical protein
MIGDHKGLQSNLSAAAMTSLIKKIVYHEVESTTPRSAAYGF